MKAENAVPGVRVEPKWDSGAYGPGYIVDFRGGLVYVEHDNGNSDMNASPAGTAGWEVDSLRILDKKVARKHKRIHELRKRIRATQESGATGIHGYSPELVDILQALSPRVPFSMVEDGKDHFTIKVGLTFDNDPLLPERPRVRFKGQTREGVLLYKDGSTATVALDEKPYFPIVGFLSELEYL